MRVVSGFACGDCSALVPTLLSCLESSAAGMPLSTQPVCSEGAGGWNRRGLGKHGIHAIKKIHIN